MTHDWRSTMLGSQYHVDGEVRGWVVEDRDKYEAQTTQGGGTVLGTYATETEAKAAVMAAQEEPMARKNRTTEHSLNLQDGEALDQTPAAAEPPGSQTPRDEDDPAPAQPPKRTRAPRADKGKPRGSKKVANTNGADPDLMVVANYIAKTNELRAQRKAIDATLDAMLDELTERQVKLAEAVEAIV